MSDNRVFYITILAIVLGLILTWVPLTGYADKGSVVLYATLYSDGSVEIKGIETFDVNQSSGSYYLQNITFYSDRTINYLKNVGYFSVQPFENVTPSTGKIDLIAVNKNGETVGNSTYILENPNGSLNGTTNYRIYRNGTNWVMWSHIILKITGSSVSTGFTDIRSVISSIGGRVIDYHKRLENGVLVIDLTSIVPYKYATLILFPFSLTEGSLRYMNTSPVVVVNNTILARSEMHVQYNSTLMEIESKSIYNAGFNKYIKAKADAYRRLDAETPNNELANLTSFLDDLAANYTVKPGTSLLVKANDTVYLVETPVIKEKNAKNPLETLISLRDLAIRTGMITGKENIDLINATIILKPGDPGVKSIEPSQTTVSNLDNVKVELSHNCRDTTVILAGIVIAILVVAGAVVFMKRP